MRAARWGLAVCALFLPWIVGLTGCGSSKGPAERTGAVASATPLSSPLLAALAGQQGQTSRNALDGMSATQLRAAVRASFAVGVNLAALNADAAGTDAVIRAALAVGTPLVFENTAALASYLTGGAGGGSRRASADGAAAMAAAVGVAVENQLVVVVPGPDGSGESNLMYCLGVGDAPPPAPTYGTLSEPLAGRRQTDPPDGSDKAILPGTVDPPVYTVTALLTMVHDAINAGLASRAARSRAAMPSQITLRETLITWPQHVWYPNGKSQDFVMDSAVRVQAYRGQGGEKTYLRLIMADAPGNEGFYNRGSLVWKDDSDKGYFSAYHRMHWGVSRYSQGAARSATSRDYEQPWYLHFGDRSPGYVEESTSGTAQSETSFDVDYTDAQSAKRTWRSTEQRSFDMRTYRCETWPGVDFRWFWYYVDKDDNDGNAREYHNINRDWKELFINKYGFGADHVRWGVDIARGTNGAKLLPKVQAWYWAPANCKEYLDFSRTEEMEVWNCYSHRHASGTVDRHQGYFTSSRAVTFRVNFKYLSADPQ
jgi:hypothetical protein